MKKLIFKLWFFLTKLLGRYNYNTLDLLGYVEIATVRGKRKKKPIALNKKMAAVHKRAVELQGRVNCCKCIKGKCNKPNR